MKRIILLNLVTILAAACLGCGSSTGTVSGTVTFHDQPIEQGLITFSPAGAEGSAAGGEIVKGKYTVANLKPARYHAIVEATNPPKYSMPGDPANNRPKTAEEMRAAHDPLPADTIGKEQEIDVKSGPQPLNFKLTSPSKK